MMKSKRTLACTLALVIALTCGHSLTARAGDRAFDVIAKHLKTQYRAKRRRIPFMGLANFAVKLVHPAGVKSIKVAIFEELDHRPGTGNELSAIMRNALSPEWQPLVHIRSRDGDQIYVFAAEAGKNVALMVVNIEGTEALVARVKVNPDRLKAFLENPKILGISLK